MRPGGPGSTEWWEQHAAAYAAKLCADDPEAARLRKVLLDVEGEDYRRTRGRDTPPGLFSVEMAPRGVDSLVTRHLDGPFKTVVSRGADPAAVLARIADTHATFRAFGMPVPGTPLMRPPVRPDLDMVKPTFPGWRFYGVGFHWRMKKLPMPSSPPEFVRFVFFVDRLGRAWRCERLDQPYGRPLVTVPHPSAPSSSGTVLNSLSRIVASMVAGGCPIIPLEPVR